MLMWHLWGNDDLTQHRATSYCGAVLVILSNQKYVITTSVSTWIQNFHIQIYMYRCVQVGASKKVENSPRHGPAVLVWHLWGNDDLMDHRATSYCGAVCFTLLNQKYLITAFLDFPLKQKSVLFMSTCLGVCRLVYH